VSAKISGLVWDLDLCQRDMLILLAITDHANHEGAMWPSVALLVWKTGYSKSTVLRTLNSLVKRNILLRRTRPGKETIYLASFDAAPKKAPRQIPEPKTKTSVTAMTRVTAMTPVSNVPVDETPTRVTHSAKPNDEPSLKEEPSPLQRPVVFKAYEDAFGMMLTPMLADELKLLSEEYPEAWVVDAMRITATNGKRSLNYSKSILRRWQTEGHTTDKPALVVVSVTDEQRAAREKQLETERIEHRIREGLA
jgi:DnaD/phage-associated family protein